jgi:hypothetical protein
MDAIQLIIIGKHTVFPSHDARHKIPFLIGIGHTLPVNDRLSGGSEVAPDGIHAILYLCNLLHCHRCARITLYTTLSFTGT